jgi:hypothetical protein
MPSQKPVVRPNTGNPLRLRAKTPRVRFLETDVTSEEHNEILDYCLKHKISVSQFLTDLVLEDAITAKTRKGKVLVNVEFELTPEEHDKLELLVHLRKKDNVDELLRDILQPHLDLQRLHVDSETKSARFYLSDKEHELVTKHIASRGIAARKYVAFLAVKAIAKDKKTRR